MTVIISPAKDALACRLTTARLVKRARADGSARDNPTEITFGFRFDLALSRYHAQRFSDEAIARYGQAQVLRVAHGKPTKNDLLFDHAVPVYPYRIDAKGSIQSNAHIFAPERHEGVCYILGVPEDRKLRVTADIDLPIRLVGWCMGEELELAPTWYKAKLYCPVDKMHPMEELWTS